MARLDPAIHRLLTQAGVELFFQSGALPVLRTASATEPVLRQVLDSSQIVVAFSEIVPEHLRDHFPVEGTTRWIYGVPSGRVRIQFNKRAERVSVSIRPFGEDAEDAVTEKLPVAVKAPFPQDAPAAPLPRARPEGPTMQVPMRNLSPEPAAAAPTAPPQGGLRIVPAQVEAPAAAPAAPPVVTDAAAAMQGLLQTVLDRRASDLHLSSESPPMLRVDGELRPEPGWAPLSPRLLQEMLSSITPGPQRQHFEAERDCDFAHEIAAGRFRVNLFVDRKGPGAVLRHIPSTIKTAEELGLSSAILDLCSLPKGLVLVTGPTGSGKSTTLAAMVDHINRTRDEHIITIEDPIEFQHPNRRCLVNQREVGAHTRSFKQALRAALREDPDVILVGELRDLETIAIAMETAETGHLVFGTLHTNTAPSTVDRIIDQFPSDRQAQVRTMLSESLRGVVAQTLCKRIGGGRVAAHEVLLVNGAVSHVIREGKTFQLPSLMQTGRAQGNSTLNDALLELVKKNLVEPQEALKKAVARAEFKGTLERHGYKLDGAPEEGARLGAAAAG